MTRQSTTSTDGTTVAYQRSGDGAPLVLVHGTAADHRRWAPVLPAFERQFTVCAVDRRGRGGSGDSTAYAVEQEFDDIAAVVDSLGEPREVAGLPPQVVEQLRAQRRGKRGSTQRTPFRGSCGR